MLSASGCGGSGEGSGEIANVRVFNAFLLPNQTASTLGVGTGATAGVNDLTGTTHVPFGTTFPSLGYSTVAVGPASLIASDENNSSIKLATIQPAQLTSGGYFLAIATGMDATAGYMAKQLLVVPDFANDPQPIQAGDVAIRLINLHANVSAALYTTVGGSPATALAGLDAVPYGYSASANGYVNVPLSSLGRLSVRFSSDLSSDVALHGNLNALGPSSAHAYTIIVFGDDSSSGVGPYATLLKDYPLKEPVIIGG